MLLDAGLRKPGGAMDSKGAGDYVTAWDRRSETAILEVLSRETPGIAVLAEESGGRRAATMWAVDPLDGTTNFTRGFPLVGVSVGLLDGGRPILGVVIGPFVGVEFTAAVGHGVYRNGERLPALGPIDPAKALVATGFPFKNKTLLSRYRPALEGALRVFEDVRRAGSAALDLAYTASGAFDGFFELGLNTWDVAAGAALVIEAGGRVTDWAGGQDWIETGNMLAGSSTVHQALLELAEQAPGPSL